MAHHHMLFIMYIIFIFSNSIPDEKIVVPTKNRKMEIAIPRYVNATSDL